MTCRVLKFAKQPYYRWLANPVSKRDWDEAQLINAAIDIHVDDPAFGYRFIADELAEASTVSPAAAPRPTTPLARLPATVHFSSVGTVQNSSVVDNKNWTPPTDVTAIDKHFWWKCSTNGHEYQQTVDHRRKSKGCPQCPAEQRILVAA